LLNTLWRFDNILVSLALLLYCACVATAIFVACC